MAGPFDEAVLLVPPGRGAAPRASVDALAAACATRGLRTREVGSAAAAEAALAGSARLVVACGGLALVSAILPAVVNRHDAVLGIFPGGVPNDFARNFGLDLHPDVAADILASPRVMPVDVGVVRCRAKRGREIERLVANHAVVGLGARVIGRSPEGSRARRVAAWWSTLLTYRARQTDVDMTFAEWHERATQVWLANGQYAWDGLLVAPIALPDDGAWDVQVWSGPRSLPFTLQPKMLRGEHLPQDDVATWRQKRVVIDSRRPSPVAVDTELIGVTPATFTMRPKALRLKI